MGWNVNTANYNYLNIFFQRLNISIHVFYILYKACDSITAASPRSTWKGRTRVTGVRPTNHALLCGPHFHNESNSNWLVIKTACRPMLMRPSRLVNRPALLYLWPGSCQNTYWQAIAACTPALPNYIQSNVTSHSGKLYNIITYNRYAWVFKSRPIATVSGLYEISKQSYNVTLMRLILILSLTKQRLIR